MCQTEAVRLPLVWPLLALLVAGGAACGGSAPANCPTFPSGCPSPVPSYASTVAPIIQSRCVVCHSPSGQEPSKPYVTYADVKKFQIDMLIQVRSCFMPPPSATPLTDDEKTQLIGWFYCDGPDN